MKSVYVFSCIAFFLFSAPGPALSPFSAFSATAFASGQEPGSHQQDDTVHLKWQDLGAGFMYHFQMSTDKDFRRILIDKKCDQPEITFRQPAASDAYYIRLRPIWPDGEAGNFSPAQRFETTTGPEPPVILSPEKIAEYRDVYDIRVSWNGVPRAAAYHVVLARDRTFQHIIYDKPNVVNTALTLWNLDYGTYFLKVSAISINGAEGPFSDKASFIVVPPVPMITTAE